MQKDESLGKDESIVETKGVRVTLKKSVKVRDRKIEEEVKVLVPHLSADSCLPCEAQPAPGRSSCFSHTPHRQ